LSKSVATPIIVVTRWQAASFIAMVFADAWFEDLSDSFHAVVATRLKARRLERRGQQSTARRILIEVMAPEDDGGCLDFLPCTCLPLPLESPNSLCIEKKGQPSHQKKQEQTTRLADGAMQRQTSRQVDDRSHPSRLLSKRKLEERKEKRRKNQCRPLQEQDDDVETVHHINVNLDDYMYAPLHVAESVRKYGMSPLGHRETL
jgi:hypothetical protein